MSEKDDFFFKKNFFKIFLLTSKMQFLQLSRDLFARTASSFPLNFRKISGLFFQIFHQIVFYGHVECGFDNPVKILMTKDRSSFVHCPKMVESFFSKIFLTTLLWTRRTQFWQLNRKKIQKKASSMSVKNRKWWWIFFKKILSIFSLTRKMQFWQLSQKIFDGKTEKLPLDVQQRSEVCFRKISSSKCSYGHVECCFDNPVDFFPT